MTSEELIEAFLEVEESNHFFDFKIGKVRFWPYIRCNIYKTLMENYGLINNNTSPDAQFDNSVNLLELIRRMTVKSQFFLCKKDILIFSFHRKVKENEGYKCVYTDLISQNLDNTYYIFDNDYDGIFYFPRNVSGVKYSDVNFYKALCKKKERIVFKGSILEENIYRVIEQNFERPLTITQKIKINRILSDCINERNYLRGYYFYVLKKIKPKVIIIVSYTNFRFMILCEVAKKLGVPVIELQHGTMGKEDIAYNFFQKRNLRCFPDYIFTFGQYEKETTRFPISLDKIYAVGYPEMEKKIRKYKKLRLNTIKKKKILFISQTFKEIFEYAVELSNRIDFNQFEIIIKLHPREFGNWKNQFGEMINGTSITIIDDSNKDIYYYLVQANYVVGISSTVLLEATMFDTNIIVIKEANYTLMKRLYENEGAVLIDSVDQLEEIVTNNICISSPCKTYFERDSIEKIKAAIHEIIKKNEN